MQNDGRLAVTASDHRPSPGADPLFASLASAFKDRAIGVVLSGCHNDGSAGARSIVDSGGTVIAQDSGSSEYSGMPKAAIELSLATLVLPLALIPRALEMHVGNALQSWFRVHLRSPYVVTLEYEDNIRPFAWAIG